MLRGMMMDRPLLVSSVIDYAAEIFPDVEVVSQTVEGGLHRYGYAEARGRIGRLANALVGLGIKPGDRVATLAWNGYRHFELYYAISGIGAVCHTINPRLFPEQITYIANHAEDTALFFDATFLPLVEKLAPALKSTAHLRADDRSRAHAGGILAAGSALLRKPARREAVGLRLARVRREQRPARSATPPAPPASPRARSTPTGRRCCTRSRPSPPSPHTFAHNRTVLPVVPLFHANAWGLPYITPLTGCPLILPGAKLDGPSLFDLMESESVDAGWGVPTVWLGLHRRVQEARPQAEEPRRRS